MASPVDKTADPPDPDARFAAYLAALGGFVS